MPESPRMIERSRCPKCETRMMLVDVERSVVGPDLRTLECPKCELAYNELAEETNETENKTGWLEPTGTRHVTLGMDENSCTLDTHFSDDGRTSSGDLYFGEVKQDIARRDRPSRQLSTSPPFGNGGQW